MARRWGRRAARQMQAAPGPWPASAAASAPSASPRARRAAASRSAATASRASWACSAARPCPGRTPCTTTTASCVSAIERQRFGRPSGRKLPCAEDAGADAHNLGAEAHRRLVVAAHAHGEPAEAVAAGDLAQQGEVQRGLFVDRRDAHEAGDLELQATALADESIQIGRAHVCTPVTNAHLVCRLTLEKKNT